MKNAAPLIEITPLQAKALANLIRNQLAAYAESEAITGAPAALPPPPFTGEDLDSIAPLVNALDAVSA